MRNSWKLLAAALLVACGGQSTTAADSNADFVSVANPTSSDNSSFYVAINKSQLGQKYFLSAYLSQYFPGAVAAGAAVSLGTRVVTFQVQNGKLFVFDAADGKEDSSTFDPQLIVDAYPIVSGVLTGSQASSYVVFDPSQGMNQYGALSDMFGANYSQVQFNIDLSYLQNFRTISDGVTFDQVFVGYSNLLAINDGAQGEPNVFRASGTLGIALRKYSEGKGFTSAPLYSQPYYFTDDAKLVPNSGTYTSDSIRWNIYKGMKPIQWKISPHVNDYLTDKQLGQYDVYGALKRAVEAWNGVFGFTVVQASLASATDSYADDDTNYVLWDEDPTFGAAFANWRNNPNTGEIRGASVYMNSLWLIDADQEYNPQTTASVRPDGVPNSIAAPSTGKLPAMPGLVWNGMSAKPTCFLPAPSLRAGDGKWTDKVAAADVTMTPKQKVEAMLTHVLVHEIGHTLGLRHNFEGSLMPVSSSVMDYLLDDDSIQLTVPQQYDVDAIKLLYGMSNAEPTEPFCTDEDVGFITNCERFDQGLDPLSAYWGPLYVGFLQQFMTGATASMPNNSLNNILRYVRAGSATDAATAWNAIIAPVKTPVAQSQLAQPGYAARVDAMANHVLSRLFLDDVSLRGEFTAQPNPSWPEWEAILTEVKGNLGNVDGARSFGTRRNMVDILKSIQTTEAYDALIAARATIASQGASLSGDSLALNNDLLSRIDTATHPYFY